MEPDRSYDDAEQADRDVTARPTLIRSVILRPAAAHEAHEAVLNADGVVDFAQTRYPRMAYDTTMSIVVAPRGRLRADPPPSNPNRRAGIAADTKRVELRAFIKQHRLGIDASTLALGPYMRAAARIGRRITQGEVAEAAGVSRVWYATLESGAPIQASTGLLVKLSETLMLPQHERELFFSLALPELRHTAIGEIGCDSIEQSFNFFQAAIKRLWLTSSPGEAVAVVGEELGKWLDDALSLVVYDRINSGSVERRAIVETRVAMRNEFWPKRRAAQTWSCAREHLELWAVLDASGAGLKRMRNGGHAFIAHPGLQTERCEPTDFIHASVRTEHSVVGVYADHGPGRGYSGNDRQIVGNLVEFLCFVIANCKKRDRALVSNTERRCGRDRMLVNS